MASYNTSERKEHLVSNFAGCHSGMDAESCSDSLACASHDGPNESKEQRKSSKQTQQPVDPFQDVAKNLEGFPGNALGSRPLDGGLTASLGSAVQGLSNPNIKNTTNHESDVKKSVDGASDEGPHETTSDTPMQEGTTMAGIAGALKGALGMAAGVLAGSTSESDESVISHAAEGGRNLAGQTLEGSVPTTQSTVNDTEELDPRVDGKHERGPGIAGDVDDSRRSGNTGDHFTANTAEELESTEASKLNSSELDTTVVPGTDSLSRS